MLIKDTEQWAKVIFGKADLGDHRRTKRLVKLSTQMAAHTGASVGKAAGDTASIEGVFIGSIRNQTVKALDIAEAGFRSLLPRLTTILALEDTTTLSYAHGISKEFGNTGTKPEGKRKGMWAHSVLMVDAVSE